MILNRLTSNLFVSDISVSAEFYTEQLGFSLIMAVPEGSADVSHMLEPGVAYSFAMLTSGGHDLMLQSRASVQEELPGAGSLCGQSSALYMQIDGVEDLYSKLLKSDMVIKALHETFYGMKEFYIKDPDGHIIGFAEKG